MLLLVLSGCAADSETDPTVGADGEIGQITLRTTTIDGATVTIPEGWDALPEGEFAAPDGRTTLTQQRITAPAPLFVRPVVFQNIGVDPVPAVETLEVDGRSWQRYLVETEGTRVDFALADDGGVLLVLLAAPLDVEESNERLYNEVFIPALEGFTLAD